MKNVGLILWNVTAICEMFKTSWQMGKHLMKDDLENHQKTFGSMVECHPVSAGHQSRLNQFGEKVFPEIFLG